MKRIVLFVVGAAVLASCSSGLEKRIADLERRVAQLENGDGTAKAISNGDLSRTVSNTNAGTTTPVVETKPDGPLPSFAFSQESHDFGSINEGDVVNHTFKFTNTGQAPLIIESARGSCGCTVPQWPKDPIPVGGEGKIEVSFNSKGKPGVQNKTVTITANTYPKITKLAIKANVQKAENSQGPVAN